DDLPDERPVPVNDASQAAPPDADAEVWLLSMLGQREAQVQARDGQPAPASDDALETERLMDVPGWRTPLNLSVNAAGDQTLVQDPVARVMGAASASAPSSSAQPNVAAPVPDAASPQTLDAHQAS